MVAHVKAEAREDGAANGASKLWIEEQTAAALPLEAEFFDEQGRKVTLGGLIDKPTILLPIYFYCPNSCSTNLANLALAMNRMKLVPGKDYRTIALSFNSDDTSEDARSAKKNYLKLLDDDFPAEQWSFITGDEKNIRAVLDTIGYTFKAQDDGTFIHPSVLVTVAKDGTVIKYVYGSFIPGDVEMAVAEAAKGVPATSVKRLLNFCFNYDPDKNKGFFQTVKIGALLIFGSFLLLFFIKILRKKGSGTNSGGE